MRLKYEEKIQELDMNLLSHQRNCKRLQEIAWSAESGFRSASPAPVPL